MWLYGDGGMVKNVVSTLHMFKLFKNRNLAKDIDLNLTDSPIDANSDELFKRCEDGSLLW